MADKETARANLAVAKMNGGVEWLPLNGEQNDCHGTLRVRPACHVAYRRYLCVVERGRRRFALRASGSRGDGAAKCVRIADHPFSGDSPLRSRAESAKRHGP